MSALYLLAYLFTGLLAVVLGKIATLYTMEVATLIGAGMMGTLCILVLIIVRRLLNKIAGDRCVSLALRP